MKTTSVTTHERESRIKNPTRWPQRRIHQAARGVSEAGRRLTTLATGAREAIDRTLAKAPPIAIDIVTVWIRHLVLTAIEIAIGGLFRRITGRPKPAKLVLFRTLDPA